MELHTSRISRAATLTAGALLFAASYLPGQDGYSVPFGACDGRAPARSLVPQLSDPATFLADPRNGTFAAEIETAPIASGWVRETRHPGFNGGAYYRWVGGNLYSTPGRGVLQYRFMADAAGRYRLAIHNRHDHPDSSLENDCWVRVNGDRWWKLYSNTGSNVRVWNWHSRLDPGHGYADFDFRAGENLVEVSGRSHGFMIDRLHAYPTTFTGALSLNIRSRHTWQQPCVGENFAVRAGDPDSQTDLMMGQTSAMLMIAHRKHRNAPCGQMIPGLGAMAGQPGEMLLWSETPPFVPPVALPVSGTGRQAELMLSIPARTELVGSRLYLQALLFDGQRGVLTEGLQLGIGRR